MNAHKIIGDNGKSQLGVSMTESHATVRIATKLPVGKTISYGTRCTFVIEADGMYPNVHKVIDDFLWTLEGKDAIISQRIHGAMCSLTISESTTGSGAMRFEMVRGMFTQHRSDLGSNFVEVSFHKTRFASSYALFFTNLILALQEDKRTVTENRIKPGAKQWNIR